MWSLLWIGCGSGSLSGLTLPDADSSPPRSDSDSLRDSSAGSPVDSDSGAQLDSSAPEQLPELKEPESGACRIELSCDGEVQDEPKTRCDLLIRDGQGRAAYQGHAGLETRGRSSAAFPKPQYNLELWDKYLEPQSANLLDMGGEDDWVLDGAYIDRALLRNRFAYETFQSWGGSERYAPETRLCTLSLNEDEQGVYFLVEKVVRDDDRVILEEDYGSGETFLIKLDDEDGFRVNDGGYGSWQLIYPDPDSGGEELTYGAKDWLDGWYTALDQPADIPQWVDIDSAVDFVLLQELVKNNDAYYLSIFMWKDRGGKLHFVPWDLDLSLGQPSYNDNENPRSWILYRSAIFEGFAASPEFMQRLPERWAELRADQLSDSRLEERMEAYVEDLEGLADANFEVWPIDEISFGWDGEDYLYEVYSHDQETDRVRSWLRERVAWMDENIQDW